MLYQKIELRARYSPELGCTVLYDGITSETLFMAAEQISWADVETFAQDIADIVRNSDHELYLINNDEERSDE